MMSARRTTTKTLPPPLLLRTGLAAALLLLLRPPRVALGFSTGLGRRTAASVSILLHASSKNSNPSFSSLIGDMASSILGKKTPAECNPEIDRRMDEVGPSWEEVRSRLESQQQTDDEERHFRTNLAKGYGIAGSPLHAVRLYDESNREEDVRVTFYRDSAR